MHLDRSTYGALRAGSLDPATARSLADHLGGSCETCEAFLAGAEGAPAIADGLDGAVDQALADAAPPSGGLGNDLEFARIMKAVRVGPAAPAAVRLPRQALVGVAVGLAAVLLLAGLVPLLLPHLGSRDRWDGVKGDATQAVPLRLRFLVLRPGAGGAPEIEKGVPGQEVPAAASLQFQVDLGRTAWVTLARARAGGDAEVFFERSLPAGRTVVSVDGQPAAYPLAALAGPQRFLALASETRIDPADAARAVSLGAEARHGDGPAISLDVVVVQVRP
jgi:hypothetical protein